MVFGVFGFVVGVFDYWMLFELLGVIVILVWSYCILLDFGEVVLIVNIEMIGDKVVEVYVWLLGELEWIFDGWVNYCVLVWV